MKKVLKDAADRARLTGLRRILFMIVGSVFYIIAYIYNLVREFIKMKMRKGC